MSDELFKTGKTYKLFLSDGMIFTGVIEQETPTHIRIIDRFDSRRILNKSIISDAKELRGDADESGRN